MPTDLDFAEFIRRVRAGDAEAAAELVRRFEPLIRRAARFRLTDPHLRRLIDSTDICQSVLAGFFVRAATGQYDLEDPDQLLKLLVGMTRNKLAFQARKHHCQKRDVRLAAGGEGAGEAADSTPSPSRIVAGKELLDEFRRRLSPEERRLADLRSQGQGWDEIAAAVGGTAKARCKQLARAADRVARELGLDDG
jgi:RNA polymerase sigma-70 factor (ECF subfamily)